MDSAEEDEEMCPEQIEQIEQIIPSTWQVPFFCQRQLSLPEAASSEIATSSFASLASTGLQSLFGGYRSTWLFEGATTDPTAGMSQVYAWREFGFYSRVYMNIDLILLPENFWMEVDRYMCVQTLGGMYNTG